MKTLSENELELMRKVLSDLQPYVIVIGSVASGTDNEFSDIDLYVKRRPQEVLDEDWYGEIEEHYIDKVIEVFAKHGLVWDSTFIGYVHTNSLDTQIEASYLFRIPKNAEIKQIEVYGVLMDSAIDDKDTPFNKCIDWIEE